MVGGCAPPADSCSPGRRLSPSRLVVLFTDPDFLVHTLASAARVVASVLISAVARRRARLPAARRAGPRLRDPRRHSALPVVVPLDRLGDPRGDLVPAGHGSIIFVQVAILVPFCMINMAEGLRRSTARWWRWREAHPRPRPHHPPRHAALIMPSSWARCAAPTASPGRSHSVREFSARRPASAT